jgi:hypothetical protein
MEIAGLILVIGLWLFVDVYLAVRMKKIYNGKRKRLAKIGSMAANVVLGVTAVLLMVSL